MIMVGNALRGACQRAKSAEPQAIAERVAEGAALRAKLAAREGRLKSVWTGCQTRAPPASGRAETLTTRAPRHARAWHGRPWRALRPAHGFRRVAARRR